MWLSPSARWIGDNVVEAGLATVKPWNLKLTKRDVVVSTASARNTTLSNSSTPGSGTCGVHSCWLVVGSICAGLVVLGVLVAGLVQRRQLQKQRESSVNVLRTPRSRVKSLAPRRLKTSFSTDGMGASGGSGSSWNRRKEDLMVEMFEPLPEDSPYSAAATLGRLSKVFSMDKGLTTIAEDHSVGSRSSGQEEKRRSRPVISPYLTSTPQRINSPIRLLRGPTPPPSPSAAYAAAMGAPPPAMVKSEKKRKLTIPYNPHNVTRRRSLEGAW